jgi:hypothetical protein
MKTLIEASLGVPRDCSPALPTSIAQRIAQVKRRALKFFTKLEQYKRLTPSLPWRYFAISSKRPPVEISCVYTTPYGLVSRLVSYGREDQRLLERLLP